MCTSLAMKTKAVQEAAIAADNAIIDFIHTLPKVKGFDESWANYELQKDKYFEWYFDQRFPSGFSMYPAVEYYHRKLIEYLGV